MGRDDLDEMDELDAYIDGNRAELEARFRELEQEDEIRRMRQRGGGAPPPETDDAGAKGGEAPPRRDPGADDPLADLKAAVDGSREVERYLLVICPACGAKNRMSLSRVRTKNPVCGACKEDLSRIRS